MDIAERIGEILSQIYSDRYGMDITIRFVKKEDDDRTAIESPDKTN